MTTFVNNDVSSGAVIYAADHNEQGSRIAAVLNGGLDNNNINASAAIDASKLADGSITSSKLATGMPVQIVSTNYTAYASGTTLIPLDDTKPQNTEGDQYMAQAITPKSATNRLLIEITATMSHSQSSIFMTGALFQDSTANALAATNTVLVSADQNGIIKLAHDMVAGTTSATTFKFRAGANGGAGTAYFNGRAGGRLYGGITVSNIKITEYKA